jgi:hypothetical protein
MPKGMGKRRRPYSARSPHEALSHHSLGGP